MNAFFPETFSPRYVFVGNRRFVLEEMLSLACDISTVITVKNSRLERDFDSGLLPPLPNRHSVGSRKALLELLSRLEFDVLISNGCPFILPVSQLPPARYVNIHPSALPDLRGVDPVIGAILYARDSGASCHLMDNGIDTGPLISQVRIPFSDDLDAMLLYQLSFVAEKMAFRRAFEAQFIPQWPQEEKGSEIYYTCAPEDRLITFTEANDYIIRKVMAFSNVSQGCLFHCAGREYKVYSCRKIYNPFLAELLHSKKDGEVALAFERGLVFKKDNEFLRFDQIISSSGSMPLPGDLLFDGCA